MARFRHDWSMRIPLAAWSEDSCHLSIKSPKFSTQFRVFIGGRWSEVQGTVTYIRKQWRGEWQENMGGKVTDCIGVCIFGWHHHCPIRGPDPAVPWPPQRNWTDHPVYYWNVGGWDTPISGHQDFTATVSSLPTTVNPTLTDIWTMAATIPWHTRL